MLSYVFNGRMESAELSARYGLGSAEFFYSNDPKAGESLKSRPRRAVWYDVLVISHESRFARLQRHSSLGPTADTQRERSEFPGENASV